MKTRSKFTPTALLALLLALTCLFALFACGKDANTDGNETTQPETPVTEAHTGPDAPQEKIKREGLWKDAVYLSNAELGTGAKTIRVEVKIEDQSVTFTLHTDRDTLGEVLTDHSLVEGEKSTYGLYIKKVNGITADYDIDKSWWNICKNGESLPSGADSTRIADGEHYELVYTR